MARKKGCQKVDRKSSWGISWWTRNYMAYRRTISYCAIRITHDAIRKWWQRGIVL